VPACEYTSLYLVVLSHNTICIHFKSSWLALFEILTAVLLSIYVFYGVTPCHWVIGCDVSKGHGAFIFRILNIFHGFCSLTHTLETYGCLSNTSASVHSVSSHWWTHGAPFCCFSTHILHLLVDSLLQQPCCKHGCCTISVQTETVTAG
jgi:hypothetical protein